jgi:GTPase SAR1 family protein
MDITDNFSHYLNKVILILGYAGSGKTTLANGIIKSLAPHVEKISIISQTHLICEYSTNEKTTVYPWNNVDESSLSQILDNSHNTQYLIIIDEISQLHRKRNKPLLEKFAKCQAEKLTIIVTDFNSNYIPRERCADINYVICLHKAAVPLRARVFNNLAKTAPDLFTENHEYVEYDQSMQSCRLFKYILPTPVDPAM